jgi:hypothetical protein
MRRSPTGRPLGHHLYPDGPAAAFIEFASMINVRPSQSNRSRGVDDLPCRVRSETSWPGSSSGDGTGLPAPGASRRAWATLSLAEQLGNVGSEVSRMRRAEGRDERLMMGAFERASSCWISPWPTRAGTTGCARSPRPANCSAMRRRAVLTTPRLQDLDRYFLAFAVAARRPLRPRPPRMIASRIRRVGPCEGRVSDWRRERGLSGCW